MSNSTTDIDATYSGDGFHSDPPLITGDLSFHDITEMVSKHAEKKTPFAWYVAFGISSSIAGLLLIMIAYLFWNGIGVWGVNNPVGWGWAIVNFVFWVGIGHAGTLISAILFLFRQKWRTSINRAAEAMTLFAVMCALVFPGISCRPCMGCVLDAAYSEPDGNVAAVQKSAALGRIRGIKLFPRFACFLVRRPGA